MNLDQMTELEDLKEELKKIQETVSDLYKKNIAPVLDAKCIEFIVAFKEHFKAKKFEVSENGNITTVKYKTLEYFLVRTNNELSINQGARELASVYIQHSGYNSGGSFTIPQDEFAAEKAKIQREIDGASKTVEAFQNPSFKFENPITRRSYDTPYQFLEDINY